MLQLTAPTNITTGDGRQLPWVKEIRYLGIHIVQSRHFKSATDNHKKSFFSFSECHFWQGWSDCNRRSNIATLFFFQSVYPCYCTV